MKKKNVINLVKYYAEKNDAGFRTEAYEIARDFDNTGDYQLAEYIMSLLSNANTFVPQMSESSSPFFEKIEQDEFYNRFGEIFKDIIGISLFDKFNLFYQLRFLFKYKKESCIFAIISSFVPLSC